MNEPNYREIDLTLAIQLQAQFEEELRVQREEEKKKVKSLLVTGHKWKPNYRDWPEPEQEKLSVPLVDPCWELLDPSPNIYDLFLTFNHQFFWGRLLGVEVKWSPRMTLCAGVCSYEGRGGLCSVRLSVPLLKLRPRKDLIETLLHEMIHAYLFVTHNNTDHDGHGPQFHKHMYRINKLSGTQISVYHSFHNEVAVYRQHVWKCNGPCRKRPPYFGLVKRSMNRAPAPRDPWWSQHVQNCGGTYTKIKEPDDYGVKRSKRKLEETSVKDIRTFFPAVGDKKVLNSSTGKQNGEKSSKLSKHVKGNLTGIGNCSSANVSPVDVQNASNAKIRGFSKSVNSKGKANSWKTNNKGNSTGSAGSKSTSRGGSTRTVSSGSVGSKTIVRKSKKTTTTEEATKSVGSNFVPFSGDGESLGNAGVSLFQPAKSRLVSQFDSTRHKRENISDSRLDGNSTTFVSGGSIDDLTTCPLCEVDLDSGQFDNHIADCLGDFADDDFGESSGLPPLKELNRDEHGRSLHSGNGDMSIVEASASSTNNDSGSVTIISDDDNLLTTTLSMSSTGRLTPEEKLQRRKTSIPPPYSCPVCDNKFSENEINQHVNTHFD